MGTLVKKIEEAKQWITTKINEAPSIGLILGSGLGEVAEEIMSSTIIPYEEIPHFPTSTVKGHKGQFVIGTLCGKKVMAMQGRFHYYEGYTMEEVTFPVRVMKSLGVESLVVTNACGGMNEAFRPGDLMVITDHLNMTGTNPLIGPNEEELGPRFPDMSKAYCDSFIELAEQVARKEQIRIQKGVYAGITGPSYMTGAELTMLRHLGADAIGMSTVPEVIVANHAGLKVLGISCITDRASGENLEPLTHEEVIRVANDTKPMFIHFVKEIVREMPHNVKENERS